MLLSPLLDPFAEISLAGAKGCSAFVVRLIVFSADPV
jgi:hypothetical protein